MGDPQSQHHHHEPYYDDEIDAEAGASNNNKNPPSTNGRTTNGMKPMAISVEYTDEIREASRWKAKLAAFLSVVFVMVGGILTRQHRSNYYASTLHHHHPDMCDGFDKNYFDEILHQVQRANNAICTDEYIPINRCKCHNPFEPIRQDRIPGWENAMQMNIDMLEKNFSSTIQPDFVLYGDSITERLLGRNFGHVSARLQGKAQVTHELFTKDGGAAFNGLPMGISGDEMAHLLYRMQNGEMPETLHPKLWWILIGTNDVGMGCSGDAIVAGNIRIVQEIRNRHESHNHDTDDAPIIINSILPRGPRNLLSANDHAVWNILRDVNQRLECYAKVTPEVYFVNATDIFTENRRDGGVYARTEYFEADYLHPNVEGCRAWETLIVEKVHSFLD